MSPNIRWALVLDADSTGTTMHVFQVAFCADRPLALLQQATCQQPTSLKSLLGSWTAVLPQLLVPLLQLPMRLVPPQEQSATTLYVQLADEYELLPIGLQQELQAVLAAGLARYPFVVVKPVFSDPDLASGRKKALWTWLAANFLSNLLGYSAEPRIDAATQRQRLDAAWQAAVARGYFWRALFLARYYWQQLFAVDETRTRAILAMDEHSLYQAHEVRDDQQQLEAKEPRPDAASSLVMPHLTTLVFDGQVFRLFSHAFEDAGLMAARARLKTAIVRATPDIGSIGAGLASTCFPAYYSEDVFVDVPYPRAVRLIGNYQGIHVADCLRHVQTLRAGSTRGCGQGRCSLADVPLLPDFHQTSRAVVVTGLGAIVLTSLFSGRASVSLAELRGAIDVVCGQRLLSNDSLMAVSPHYCIDLLYLYDTLFNAFQLSNVEFAQGLQTGVISWPLGVALQVLSDVVRRNDTLGIMHSSPLVTTT